MALLQQGSCFRATHESYTAQTRTLTPALMPYQTLTTVWRLPADHSCVGRWVWAARPLRTCGVLRAGIDGVTRLDRSVLESAVKATIGLVYKLVFSAHAGRRRAQRCDLVVDCRRAAAPRHDAAHARAAHESRSGI
jgi:hypothetical protein